MNKQAILSKDLDAVGEINSTKELTSLLEIPVVSATLENRTGEMRFDSEHLQWLYQNQKITLPEIKVEDFLKGEHFITYSLTPQNSGNSFSARVSDATLDNYPTCTVFGRMHKSNFTESEIKKSGQKLCKVAKFFSNLYTNPLREDIYQTEMGGKKDNPEVKEFLQSLNELKRISPATYVEAVKNSLLEGKTPLDQIQAWVDRFEAFQKVFNGEVSFEEALLMEEKFKAQAPLRLFGATKHKAISKPAGHGLDESKLQQLRDLGVYFQDSNDSGRWVNFPKLDDELRSFVLSNSTTIRRLPGFTKTE